MNFLLNGLLRVYWSSDGQDLVDAEAILSKGPPFQLPNCDFIDGVSPAVFMVEALVQIELPAKGLQLQIPSNCNGEGSADASSSRRGPLTSTGDGTHDAAWGTLLDVGRPLAYLPPICLDLVLPQAYPLSEPPIVVDVRAIWLSAAQSEMLKEELLSHWHEAQAQSAGLGPGPIIFQWTEWLRSSALAFLGICENLTIGPKEVAKGTRPSVQQSFNGEASSLSSANPPAESVCEGVYMAPVHWTAEEVVMSLIRYSGNRSHEAFLHECFRSAIISLYITINLH